MRSAGRRAVAALSVVAVTVAAAVVAVRVGAEAPTTAPAPGAAAAGGGVYEHRAASPDGIGKVYLGREIAKVMGHEGAGWLERPEREREERPSVLIRHLDLRPTDVVADVGAGTGYFAVRLAKLVPQGRVLAVDIQPEMLDHVRAAARDAGVTNVEPVLGTATDPNLPAASVDVALLVDAYHEFDHPFEVMSAVAGGLKPGGRVVLVEYRAEDPDVPIKPLHKMSQAQAVREMAAVGLAHERTLDVLPWQHLMVFRKPG